MPLSYDLLTSSRLSLLLFNSSFSLVAFRFVSFTFFSSFSRLSVLRSNSTHHITSTRFPQFLLPPRLRSLMTPPSKQPSSSSFGRRSQLNSLLPLPLLQHPKKEAQKKASMQLQRPQTEKKDKGKEKKKATLNTRETKEDQLSSSHESATRTNRNETKRRWRWRC